jgi:hypothetical protein
MSRLVKFWALGSLGHAVLTFALFSLVWFLPEGVVATVAGAGFDILAQPFVGPRRLLAADPLLDLGQGLPAVIATSALWGFLFAVLLTSASYLRRQN